MISAKALARSIWYKSYLTS